MVQASPEEFALYVDAFFAQRVPDEAAATHIMVQVDDEIVMKKNGEIPEFIKNSGRAHAEAMLKIKMPEFIERGIINEQTNLIEVWIHFSPCAHQCSNVLLEIESDIHKRFPAIRFKWYYDRLYVNANHTRTTAQQIVENYKKKGIVIMSLSEAMEGVIS